MENSNHNKNNNFGSLHLLAAAFVLYGHQCALLNQGTPLILGCQIQAIGVKIIFLISGYLITKSLFAEKGSAIRFCSIFTIKRLGRLYPEYIFCLVISALIIGPIFSELSVSLYFENRVWLQYIVNNLRLFPTYGLPGVFLNNPYMGAVNGSLWTMPVEVFAYAMLLVFGIACRNNKNRNIIYSMLVMVILLFFVCRFIFFPDARVVIYGSDWIAALNVIPYMFVGGFFYVFDLKNRLNPQVAFFIFFAANGVVYNTEILRELVCLMVLPYLVFSLGLSDEQHLKLRVLKSEYAYGIYLWGFIVQQCIIQIFMVRFQVFLTVNQLFVVSAVVTYIIAAVSYEVVYTPIGSIIRNLTKRESEG